MGALDAFGTRYGFTETLNAKNLEALGAEPLAELLIEISRGNAAAQRRLRLAPPALPTWRRRSVSA